MSTDDYNPFLAEAETGDGENNPFEENGDDDSFIEVMDGTGIKTDSVPPTIQVWMII